MLRQRPAAPQCTYTWEDPALCLSCLSASVLKLLHKSKRPRLLLVCLAGCPAGLSLSNLGDIYCSSLFACLTNACCHLMPPPKRTGRSVLGCSMATIEMGIIGVPIETSCLWVIYPQALLVCLNAVIWTLQGNSELIICHAFFTEHIKFESILFVNRYVTSTDVSDHLWL